MVLTSISARASAMLLGAASAVPLAPVRADSVAEFYAGRTVTIQVGYSVGGGYDLYARTLAPSLAKHIPGKPSIVVKNLPGAGSLKLAIYMQSVAPRNGTEIATVSRGAPVEDLLVGSKTNFDPLGSSWIGSMNNEVSVCLTMARTGAATLEDLRRKEYSFGTQGKGSDSELFAVFVRNLLGAKLKVITGYPGTNESILAMERGEVDGNCSWSWSSAKQSRPDWLKDKVVNIIMQMSLTKHPDLPDVPLVMEYARNDSERAQMELLLSRQIMGRPFFVPPGVPADRVAALRKAFMAALDDPEFKALSDRLKLEINPVSGEDVQALVEKVLKTPVDVVAAARRNIGDGR